MDASVPYDVVCVGPVTLDVTLAGLDALPAPGEERFGSELVFSPGAFATIAVGAARLGLRAAVVAARARDPAGDYLSGLLAAEGVTWLGPESERAAVTLVFPLGGDRALASFDPRPGSSPWSEATSAAAFVIGPGDLPRVPADGRAYVMTGSLDDRPWVQGAPADRSARALFANEREAMQLTGAPDPDEAVLALAGRAETAVVTLGAAGAVACGGRELVRVPAPSVEVRDATGAGDLFAAAYVWADRAELPLEARLRWAVLYASLSVRAVGAVPGAASLAELLDAGRDQGLTLPP